MGRRPASRVDIVGPERPLRILTRLAELSAELGTKLEIADRVGRIAVVRRSGIY